jgi:hypothetical protein
MTRMAVDFKTLGQWFAMSVAEVIAALLILVGACSARGAQGADLASISASAAYHFRLTRSKELPVCTAYEKLLNTATYTPSPFCGRPVSGNVPGFQPIRRVPLSGPRMTELVPYIDAFNLTQRSGKVAYPSLSSSDIDRLRGRTIFAWEYEPRVDIDNDGRPDNIIVWKGSPISGWDRNWECGKPIGDRPPPEGLRVEQYAYVLTEDGSAVDVEKTIASFGHPHRVDRYKDPVTGKMIQSERFVPIGPYIGIFEYEHLYYFDTFYTSDYGDLEGNRKDQRKLEETLAVFLRQKNVTKSVCEYKLNILVSDIQ